MNAPTELSNVVQMTTPPAQQNVSSTALMLDNASMDKMMRLADFMASGKSALPMHLRGSPGDCLAIVMQACQWNLNPFAVAQKTHIVNGVLGYEAQLVAAVINTSKIVIDRFNFDWFGDWKKVIGKFQIKKGDKGEYRVPGWQLSDEEGLGIRVWATLRGEAEPRVLELLLAQARVRNSTLWADDPKQQLAYLAQKRWARLYASDVILGVYSPDEFDAPAPRDMGPADVVNTTGSDKKAEYERSCREAAKNGWVAFGVAFNAIPKDERHLVREVRMEVEAEAKRIDAARTVETAPSKPTQQPAQTNRKSLAEVMKMLVDAKTIDALYVAGDWVGDLDDPEERKLAAAKFEEIKFVLEME